MEFLIEAEADNDEVEHLYDLCFAPGRQGLSSYQLRDGVDPVSELSMICRDETGGLIGAIRYWPVQAGGDQMLLLGPVAVHPIAQGEGIAAILIRRTLEMAATLNWERVILVGDAPYYQRFGFERHYTKHLKFPPPTNPERFLGRALVDGAFDGVSGLVENLTIK